MKRNFKFYNLAQHAFIAQDTGPNCWLVEPIFYNPNGKKKEEEKQQVIINYGFVLVFR